MYDDNLPPWLSQEELEARDEELTDDDFTDIWDDSDEYESLEARLEPLLDNIFLSMIFQDEYYCSYAKGQAIEREKERRWELELNQK